MANPKRRRSTARQGNRRAHKKLSPINLSPCPQCHTPRPPHQVCPNCGTYHGREVLPLEEA